MKNYCKTIGALVAASAFAAGNVSAEIESEVAVGYTSEYLFRGNIVGQDLAETAVNVATSWNQIDLSAGAWYGSFENGTAGAIDQSYDELDLFAEASKDLGYFTAAVGYIAYLQDSLIGDDAHEVYFAVSKQFYGIDFSLAYFWDIETDNDGYTELKASKGYELSSCLTLSTSAALGYVAEEGDAAYLAAKVALDYAYSETATISPFVMHSWGLGETTNYTSENEVVAGTMLSVSF